MHTARARGIFVHVSWPGICRQTGFFFFFLKKIKQKMLGVQSHDAFPQTRTDGHFRQERPRRIMILIPFISYYFLFWGQTIMTLNYYESYETGKQKITWTGKWARDGHGMGLTVYRSGREESTWALSIYCEENFLLGRGGRGVGLLQLGGKHTWRKGDCDREWALPWPRIYVWQPTRRICFGQGNIMTHRGSGFRVSYTIFCRLFFFFVYYYNYYYYYYYYFLPFHNDC